MKDRISRADVPAKGPLLVSGAFFLFFLGVVLLLALHRTVLPDRAISERLSDLPSSVYLFFSILCRTGNVEIELPLLLISGGILWLTKREERPVLLFFLSALVLGTLFEHLLKMNLPRYFPTREFRHDPFSGWGIFFPTHFRVISSFPSGHAFRALLILFFIDRYYPRLRHAAFAWVLLIMTGIVVLGWHWSSDVLGSICLAFAVRPWIPAFEKIKKS